MTRFHPSPWRLSWPCCRCLSRPPTIPRRSKATGSRAISSSTPARCMPELRLHYTTVGEPVRRAGAGAARHDRLGGQHADARPSPASCSAPASRSTPTKYYIILPDGIGHGKSSKPSDGLQAKFPQYDYDDMVEAQYRLLTEGLGIRHLRLVIGNSMGGMHTWLWGTKYPDFMDALVPMAAQPTRDGEPQLDDAAADHRIDPQRSGMEQRQLHGAAAPSGRSPMFFGIATIGRHAGLPEGGADARAADKMLDERLAAPSPPMPTTPSTSGNPRATTTPRPAWRASRRRCWPSMPPTTSAIRRRPA